MNGPTKWWGWGFEGRSVRLEAYPELVALLRAELGVDPTTRRAAVGLPDVVMEPSRLEDEQLAALVAIAGEDSVHTDPESRVRHAAGKSYRDLVALRAGRPPRAPDAVLCPRTEEHVAAIVEEASRMGVVVVPFGGGTSVVGGVEPLVEDRRAAVSIDLAGLRRLVTLDGVSRTAVAEAGISGPVLEDALSSEGFTLGHFPQSFEFSTLGGWAATRGAGALSNRYGRIEDLVAGLRLVHPGGILDTRHAPASAAGPSLKEIVLGSEGILGIITQVTVRIRPVPAARRWASYYFRSFGAGVEALRAMAQTGPLPAMTYLSDEAETRVGSVMGTPPIWTLAGVLRRLGGRRARPASVLNLGYEGTEEEVELQRRCARIACGAALLLGEHPARRLASQRFETPYLRDALLDRAVLVETLETATSWSGLHALHERTRSAIESAVREDGLSALVLCHVSHVYPDGASLYFTILARQKEGDEIGQWRRLKDAATAAIVDAGGTVTHHHGVGLDHRPWIEREWGASGVLAVRALKERLDPRNVMNPGKLLP